MADKETWSSWECMTGEAFEGTHEGKQLETWSIRHTTVAAALVEFPGLAIHVSTYWSLGKVAMEAMVKHTIQDKGFIPPMFKFTMSGPIDDRIDRLRQGLGVTVGKEGRYYPMDTIGDGIEDQWDGRVLTVVLGALDGVPRAAWKDDGSEPDMQLFTRWYGFSFNYPGCKIWGETSD